VQHRHIQSRNTQTHRGAAGNVSPLLYNVPPWTLQAGVPPFRQDRLSRNTLPYSSIVTTGACCDDGLQCIWTFSSLHPSVAVTHRPASVAVSTLSLKGEGLRGDAGIWKGFAGLGAIGFLQQYSTSSNLIRNGSRAAQPTEKKCRPEFLCRALALLHNPKMVTANVIAGLH